MEGTCMSSHEDQSVKIKRRSPNWSKRKKAWSNIEHKQGVPLQEITPVKTTTHLRCVILAGAILSYQLLQSSLALHHNIIFVPLRRELQERRNPALLTFITLPRPSTWTCMESTTEAMLQNGEGNQDVTVPQFPHHKNWVDNILTLGLW